MVAISFGLNAIILSHVPSFVEKKLSNSLLNIVVFPFLVDCSGAWLMVFLSLPLASVKLLHSVVGLTMREAVIREVHKEDIGGDKESFKHPASQVGLKYLIYKEGFVSLIYFPLSDSPCASLGFFSNFVYFCLT